MLRAEDGVPDHAVRMRKGKPNLLLFCFIQTLNELGEAHMGEAMYFTQASYSNANLFPKHSDTVK